jgi:hypothetical protein
MNRTEVVRAVVWLDQLAARAKDESRKLREQLQADARAEWQEQGTAPTWRIPDVATVAASVTHESVVVEDMTALTRWMEQRYPTEVETVRSIRPAFLAGFLPRAKPAGDVVCDPETGEVIPGLGVREGGQFGGISVRVTAAAKEVFGALADHGLRELVAAAGPAVPVVLAELEAGGA